jgi:hypothetical protein
VRYFLPELLIDTNWSERQYRRARLRFERNLKLYNKQLATLEGRVSSAAWRFMTRVNRHDGTLLSIEAGDFVFGATRTDRSHLVNRRRANVVVRFAEPEAGVVYEITYSGIKAFSLEYSKIPEWRWSLRECFDDWLIDEWSSSDENHLCHEVLFSSGAWFRIVFRGLKLRRRAKAKPER